MMMLLLSLLLSLLFFGYPGTVQIVLVHKGKENGRLVLTRDKMKALQLPLPPEKCTEDEDIDTFFDDAERGPTIDEIREDWHHWFHGICYLLRVKISTDSTPNEFSIEYPRIPKPEDSASSKWNLATPDIKSSPGKTVSTKFPSPQKQPLALNARQVYLFFRDT